MKLFRLDKCQIGVMIPLGPTFKPYYYLERGACGTGLQWKYQRRMWDRIKNADGKYCWRWQKQIVQMPSKHTKFWPHV